MTTKELKDEALSLPVEERAMLADALLQSLNGPDPEIDHLWAEEIRRRVEDMKAGKVQLIPGEEVFARIRDRYKA